MTCKEAEQMVMPYINDELTDKELEAFLDHVYSCKACYEELEIYYIGWTDQLATRYNKKRGSSCCPSHDSRL